MQRILLLICLLSALLMPSCGLQEKHNAQEHVNRFTRINDSLEMLTTQWHDQLDRALVTKNFVNLQTYRLNLGMFLSNTRSDVANMKTTSKNEPIRNAIDSVFAVQSTIVADVYPRFEMLSALTPKKEVDTNLVVLKDDLANVKAAHQKIKNMITDYANKYGLKKKNSR